MKTSSATTETNINRVGVLKHTDIHLKGKEDIPIFYRDICTQGAQYNVHLTKLEGITDITDTTNTTVPAILSNVFVIALTGKLLYQKLKN